MSRNRSEGNPVSRMRLAECSHSAHLKSSALSSHRPVVLYILTPRPEHVPQTLSHSTPFLRSFTFLGLLPVTAAGSHWNSLSPTSHEHKKRFAMQTNTGDLLRSRLLGPHQSRGLSAPRNEIWQTVKSQKRTSIANDSRLLQNNMQAPRQVRRHRAYHERVEHALSKAAALSRASKHCQLRAEKPAQRRAGAWPKRRSTRWCSSRTASWPGSNLNQGFESAP